MMTLGEMIGVAREPKGGEPQGETKLKQILHLCKKLKAIGEATDQIRYNEELFGEVPEIVKTLAAAKEAVVAELKTL